MVKLSRDDVLKLAQLSRLHLTEDEIAQFGAEISTILGYVEQLQNADVHDLPLTDQVTGLKNIMRPDVIKDYGTDTNGLLKNAPATENGHIKVKRMLR